MKKRILSLLLAISVLLGISVTAGASTSTDVVVAAKQPLSFNKSYDVYSLQPNTFTESSPMLFPLTADMFEWSSGQQKGNEAVTSTQLRNITASYAYTSSSATKDIISNVTLVTATVNGMRTVCVKVNFVKEFVSVNPRDFDVTIFLRRSNIRMRETDERLIGTFENPVQDIDSNKLYIDISKGIVLRPTEYIRAIEIGIGSGITIDARLTNNSRYYGVATIGITEDDEALVRKYPSIVDIYTLKTINLKFAGKVVLIEGYGSDCYVYDETGKYLGTTGGKVEYSDKYYITDRRIDMSGLASASGSSGSSASSSSSSSSSSKTSSGSTAGAAVTVNSITSLTQSAVNTAKSSGSKVASVRVKDMGSISNEAVGAMVKTASASGMTARLDADTMNGSSVVGRLTMSPTSSTSLTSDIKLGVYVSSTTVTDVKAKFGKWYKNSLTVVSLAHKSAFGMNVTIAAKVSLTGMNTKNLYFYAYNADKNQYQQIKSPNYAVDTNGYLHFTTSVGGEIVITDGALALK